MAKLLEAFAWCLFFMVRGDMIMYLHRKLESPELMDLLMIHTNRFTRIMIHGETYDGEYEVCKRTIELIQEEIFSRQPYYSKFLFSDGKFDHSPVQH